MNDAPSFFISSILFRTRLTNYTLISMYLFAILVLEPKIDANVSTCQEA